jgi:hypothetical protein
MTANRIHFLKGKKTILVNGQKIYVCPDCAEHKQGEPGKVGWCTNMIHNRWGAGVSCGCLSEEHNNMMTKNIGGVKRMIDYSEFDIGTRTDELSRMICEALKSNPKTANELADELGVGIHLVSPRLQALKKAMIVTNMKAEVNTTYWGLSLKYRQKG